MDRDKPGVTKSQPGFVDFVVRPLFETWVACFPDCKVGAQPHPYTCACLLLPVASSYTCACLLLPVASSYTCACLLLPVASSYTCACLLLPVASPYTCACLLLPVASLVPSIRVASLLPACRLCEGMPSRACRRDGMP
jgi:hypothetical protein